MLNFFLACFTDFYVPCSMSIYRLTPWHKADSTEFTYNSHCRLWGTGTSDAIFLFKIQVPRDKRQEMVIMVNKTK